MSFLFRPAVILMNRLKYLQKFSLIGLLFLITVSLNLYLLLSEINIKIDFAEKERLGIYYSDNIRVLLEDLQQHRGMVNAYLSGDASFKNRIIDKQSEIDESIQTIDRLDRKLGGLLDTATKWSKVKEGWPDLKYNAFNLRPHESFYLHDELIKKNFDIHTALISNLLHLITHIRDTSGLKLDPEQDSYYLMDTVVNKLPLLIESVGKARGIGSGVAAKKRLDESEKKQLIILSGTIQTSLNELERRSEQFNNSELYDHLYTYIQNHVQASSVFLKVLNKEIIEVKSIRIQPVDFFGQGTEAINSGFKLYDMESPILDRLLLNRIEQLTGKKLLVILFASLIILLIFYLFIAFYMSVIRTVFSLKRTSMRIVAGDLSARANIMAKDELEYVGKAFNKIADAFGEALEKRLQHEKAIEQLAYFDILTGLPNRVLFNVTLQSAITLSKQGEKRLAVMFLDLDRFKNINDTLGHDAGDALLKALAERFKRGLREDSVISRMGGDEFLFLIPDIHGPDDAVKIAEKVLSQLNVPVAVNGYELIVTASIGISLYPDNGDEVETLIKHADTAMYYSKNHGKNRYQLYDSKMNAEAEKRLQMEIDLRRALEQEEFILYYQPRFDLSEGRISGMEALIRWRQPGAGLVLPGEFIPLAEESGLVVPIGEWVLRTACAEQKTWQEPFGYPVCVSVNISAAQFQSDKFVELVKENLERFSLEPSLLELELTESIVMKNADETVSKLQRLKNLGVRIAIDDFGTGFSSLSYLKNFPIDTLKIDRSFIKDIPVGHKDTAITKSIIALGRRLHVKVVAEGVENGEQLSFLSARRCNEVQGYHIGRPLPAEEVIQLLHKGDLKKVNSL